MPFVHVTLLEGRTEAQRRRLIEKVTDAIVEAVGAPRESVRVWISEVNGENWGIAGVSIKDRADRAARNGGDEDISDRDISE